MAEITAMSMTSWKRTASVGCFVLLLPALVWAAADRGVLVQERRTALVMGNGAYESGPLKKPANDATDMAATLKRLVAEGYALVMPPMAL
ncbi:MAG: hypothetical protein ABIJ57_07720 [Pseudomonadota bacterium]|nr:hypothetical protein [Pseudomonadota bacterium]MBU4120766.1 hypothetical protein [Pseudomonadota bacterium]